MEDWKQSSPSSNFYFRPYIKDASNTNTDAGITNTDAGNANTDTGNPNADTGNANIDTGTRNSRGHKTFVGNSVGDDDDYIWWEDLLVKFGNTITLLDATYKTTKYDFSQCQN